MREAKQRLDRIVGTAIVALMAALVLDVLWQVFTRFVLRDPSSWTEELARFLMIWVGLLGAGYAAGRRMHLSVDLLSGRLKGHKRTALALTVEGFTLLFALAALVAGGGRLVWTMLYLGQTSASLGIPLGWLYLVVPVSGLIIAFHSVCAITEAVRGR